jgi:hypothetical protein
LLLKVLVSAGLLIFFFSRIELETFWRTLAAANLSYISLALIVYLVTQLASAGRWSVLTRPLGFRAPYQRLASYYLIGMFFNLFAPSTVGGDVSRIYYLARDSAHRDTGDVAGSLLHAAVSVFMDRALGMIVLVWLGAIGLAISAQYAVPPPIRLLTFALALGFVVGGLLIPVLRRVLPADGHPLVVKLRIALRSYRSRWRVIPLAILISFAVHLIQAWIHLILGRAIQIEIPFTYCLILYPLVGTFSALPVSLNGLGLREGGYLFLLGVIGIGSEQSIAFGLILFIMVAADSLLGGIVFLLKRPPKPSAIVAETKIK